MQGGVLKRDFDVYDFVASDGFGKFIMAVIIVAGILVGLETSPELVEKYGAWLWRLDLLVIAIFTVEIALKMWTGFHYDDDGRSVVRSTSSAQAGAKGGVGNSGWLRRRIERLR